MNTKAKSEAVLDFSEGLLEQAEGVKVVALPVLRPEPKQAPPAPRGVLAFDPGPPPIRTVALDQLLTGFRRLPEIIEDIADQVERRHALSVVAGGKR